MLLHAARVGDLSVFEYLMERGAVFDDIEMEGSEDNAMIDAMLRRYQEWIKQAVLLAGHWHVPLTSMRVIHEYVVGFNW